MALYITSLNSGSNGNCYYVGNDSEAVLVDVGITCKEVELRMKRLGLDINKVKAIFISHEHSDHINGVPMLCRRYGLPVYVTQKTLRHCKFWLNRELICHFTSFIPLQIGNLIITGFPKLHDASEPHSFIVSDGGTTVGVFTDIGAPCQQLTHHFAQCDAAFLESNYDEDMLENGQYPLFLKNRIRGGSGHLSNHQAVELFKAYRPLSMSHLILSHLSKENNCPRLVADLFMQHSGDTEIVVASRYKETPLYTVGNCLSGASSQQAYKSRAVQASLF